MWPLGRHDSWNRISYWSIAPLTEQTPTSETDKNLPAEEVPPDDPRAGLTSIEAAIQRAQVKAALFGTATREERIGRYVIEQVLGEGAMGTVFIGHDKQLGRRVAIKQIKGGDDEGRRARILREAQALARLSHPNVVPIYEVGEHDGRIFFAMELVEGTTLQDWTNSQPRHWREVVECYMQAGRGLAAAHEVELVHRDFKPHNAVVGDDGRVRVLDFGVAALGPVGPLDFGAATIADTAASSPDGEMLPLTSTGSVVGTPAYMAPEQLRAASIDARADQFSFCVALYEALYGKRPFGNESVRARIAGEDVSPTPPPRGHSTPRRVWRVLERGLATDPAARFNTMSELVLAVDPTRARRRVVLAASAVGVTGVVTTVAVAGRGTTLCEPDQSAIAQAWDDSRRAAVQHAFESSDLEFSGRALSATEAMLDRWSSGWVEARSSACRETRIEGTQSEQRLDSRMACLERQRRVFDAQTRVLGEADKATVARSERILASLPDVDACADIHLLEDVYPLPDDPALVATIANAREDIARAEALQAADGLGASERISSRVREVVEHVPYPPVQLESRLLTAGLLVRRDNLDDGIPQMLAIAREAEGLRLDDMVASVRVRMAVAAVGEWSHPVRERWLLADAEAAVKRVGRDYDRRGLRLAVARGRLLWRGGRHDEAIELLRLALNPAEVRGESSMQMAVLAEIGRAELDAGRPKLATEAFDAARRVELQLRGPASPGTADLELDLSLAAIERGEPEEASAHLDAAREIYARVFGPHSLPAANAGLVRVKMSVNAGDLSAARALLDEVLPAYQELQGDSSERAAEAYTASGVLHYYAAAYPESIRAYRRALEIRRRVNGPEHLEVGILLSNIAESRLATGDAEGSLESFDEAIATMAKTHTEDHPRFATPLKGRGLALLELGRMQDAASDLEKALSLHEAFKAEPMELAATRFALARALSSNDPARARALATQAGADFKQLSQPKNQQDVESWLTRQPTQTEPFTSKPERPNRRP